MFGACRRNVRMNKTQFSFLRALCEAQPPRAAQLLADTLAALPARPKVGFRL